MPKKQNKPIKTCADCIHESACRGWTNGRAISDISASQCPNHQTVKESGAYLCGVLDERKRKKTNADRIRSMSDEELAERLALMTTICEFCAKRKNCDDPSGYNQCMEGILDWLQQPAEEADNETVGERQDGDDNG